MTNEEFESKLKSVFEKMNEAAGENDNPVLSGDPDCVADIGVDKNGCLSFNDETLFPDLKISDITDIKYRFEDAEEDYNRSGDLYFYFSNKITLRCGWNICYYPLFGTDFGLYYKGSTLAYGEFIPKDKDAVIEKFNEAIKKVKDGTINQN